ncbi:MAG: hypothetical protein IPL78_05120 [Chloroflexi bacterium]|nr:hypothetical protein [Chloroflexota bacterium]
MTHQSLDEALKNTVAHAYEHSPVFKQRLAGFGLKPENIQTIADLSQIPVMTKDEALAIQQANPPFGGMLAVPLHKISRIFLSPGPLYEPAPTLMIRNGMTRPRSCVSVVLSPVILS